MKLFKLIAMFGFFSAQALAVTVHMTTRDGKDFSLDTSAERVTTKTSEVTVCGDHVDQIKRVKLWMTEHGHGSTPTLLGDVSEGCRIVTKLNFTMTGEWDVRVELADGDAGAFVVSVDRD